ncbi:MAG TPA: M20/M25/M40 family metallo-hydrolase [Xanthobacteraceae bacterium]|nr:M20/M25/M40 family metallo-hydrolase [Xanthobacteraceae bacterium]
MKGRGTVAGNLNDANPGSVLEALDSGLDQSIERLYALLKIPSISTDPAHRGDCEQAAAWLARELSDLGFRADVRATNGLPMVIGHYGAGDGKPHVLFYGHYDVQPPDPLEMWQSPPFEPRMVEEGGIKRIVGRGTADDKGQLMTFIEACRAYIKAEGKLPLSVSVMLEGEEETGSPSLKPFLDKHKKELKADVALVCDTDMWDTATPAITTMLRGLVLEEVTVTGPNRDLHSGLFGGPALNPIHALGRVLGLLHNEQGRIVIPAFYDGVNDLAPELQSQWNRLDFDARKYLAEIGQTRAAGEANHNILEQMWARPTCDVNGIWGGYTGPGSKTVIPSKAHAKVSFRLVNRQSPEKVQAGFREFVRKRLPADFKAEFHSHGASPALQLPLSSPYLQKARVALKAEWGKEAVLKGSGGSIPIVGSFKRDLGMDSLLIGFGLDDDRIHSPNEKYNLLSFHKGARSWVRVLAELAR